MIKSLSLSLWLSLALALALWLSLSLSLWLWLWLSRSLALSLSLSLALSLSQEPVSHNEQCNEQLQTETLFTSLALPSLSGVHALPTLPLLRHPPQRPAHPREI